MSYWTNQLLARYTLKQIQNENIKSLCLYQHTQYNTYLTLFGFCLFWLTPILINGSKCFIQNEVCPINLCDGTKEWLGKKCTVHTHVNIRHKNPYNRNLHRYGEWRGSGENKTDCRETHKRTWNDSSNGMELISIGLHCLRMKISLNRTINVACYRYDKIECHFIMHQNIALSST